MWQPKLKTGFWLDGDVVSLSVTPSTGPFSADTLTFHWAFWPRATLAWSLCRLTHSSGAGEAAAGASVRVKLSNVAARDPLPPSWVMNAVVLAVCVALPDLKPLIRGLSRPLVSGEPDPLSDVDEAEPDGDEEEPDGDEEPDEPGSVVGDGVVVLVEGDRIGVTGVGGAVLVELAPGLDGVLVPEPEPVELGGGLEDGGGAGTQSFLVTLLTADVRAVWVRSADAAGARMATGPSGAPACPDVVAATMPKLDADTTRKPPAARLTVGRTCGKRMKALPLPGCCFCETSPRLAVATSDAYHHV